jgi:hypothetical protein
MRKQAPWGVKYRKSLEKRVNVRWDRQLPPGFFGIQSIEIP